MITIGLDENWDIGLDDFNNIAIKNGNEQMAQDVASSVRVWKNELPFDRFRGIAYNEPDEIRSTLSFEIRKQAKLISGVRNATVVFNEVKDRDLDMTIYVETESGERIDVQ